jgi:hypothetical protein
LLQVRELFCLQRYREKLFYLKGHYNLNKLWYTVDKPKGGLF